MAEISLKMPNLHSKIQNTSFTSKKGLLFWKSCRIHQKLIEKPEKTVKLKKNSQKLYQKTQIHLPKTCPKKPAL